jgi:hypothetical protein
LGTAAAKQWSKLGSHLKHLNLTFPSVSFHSGIRNDPAFFWSEPDWQETLTADYADLNGSTGN